MSLQRAWRGGGGGIAGAKLSDGWRKGAVSPVLTDSRRWGPPQSRKRQERSAGSTPALPQSTVHRSVAEELQRPDLTDCCDTENYIIVVSVNANMLQRVRMRVCPVGLHMQWPYSGAFSGCPCIAPVIQASCRARTHMHRQHSLLNVLGTW